MPSAPKDDVEELHEKEHTEPNLEGDRLNVALLVYLYALQFIPHGLIQAIPLVLQNRKATYQNQAEFTLVSYSFDLKLFWAPIVDCVYSKVIGRRKTWLIPTQYLLGLTLLVISMNVDNWLGSDDGMRLPQMRQLIIAFFFAIFLSATQDIVVDGWSLTMLQKWNVGYASTSNHVGSLVGSFLGFVPFILLDSKDFANMFRKEPQNYGFMTFADFLLFWSLIFMASTTLIWMFKKDNSTDELNEDFECRIGFLRSYKRLWQISNIEPVRKLCFILVTCNMGFAAVNGVAPLKLMDAGVPRDKFVLMTIPSIPFIMIVPFIFSRYLSGQRSMNTFLVTYIFKLLLGIVYTIFVYFTPYAKKVDGAFPVWYYWVLLFIYNIDHMSDFIRILAAGAFFRRKCDSRFGGMYITIFSVISHIGTIWPASVSLWLVNFLTIKYCAETNATGQCQYVIIDGFFVEAFACVIIGLVWFYWSKRQIRRLESTDQMSWRMNRASNY